MNGISKARRILYFCSLTAMLQLRKHYHDRVEGHCGAIMTNSAENQQQHFSNTYSIKCNQTNNSKLNVFFMRVVCKLCLFVGINS